MKGKNLIECYLKICKNIKEYEVSEFGHEFDDDEELFDENLQCPIAYTTKGDDEEFEIQVTLDLKNNRIIKELTHPIDNYTELENYESWEEIAEVTEYLNFEDLIMTDVDIDDLLAEYAKRENEIAKSDKNYQELVSDMNKMEYKETLKAVFCFETGIEDESYLNSMAEYFMNSQHLHNFLDEELYEKQLSYYKTNK
ncbi:hypothetical protein ACUYUN_002590 [Staphylococcus pseudintermedius]